MWRNVRLALSHFKVSVKYPHQQKLYSTSTSRGGTGKVILGIVVSTGLGFTGALVYGKYEPKFKSLLQEYIPFVDNIYKMFPDADVKFPAAKEVDFIEKKLKDSEKDVTPSLLKKKLDREITVTEVRKPSLDKSSVTGQSKDDKYSSESNILKTELMETGLPLKSAQIGGGVALYENALNDTISKLKKVSEEAINVHKNAASAVKVYTEKLYKALDLSEGSDDDLLWKEATSARTEKEKILNLAKRKASETRNIIEKLTNDSKKLAEHNTSSPLLIEGEALASKYLSELQKVESEVEAAEFEAKTATEYEELVKTSKEQFRKELQIVLPNYLQDNKDKTITEGDLNLLIAHAHRRIEQLQKQIAKMQVTEKIRVDEALKKQKTQEEILNESMVQVEMQKHHLDLESAVDSRVASLKANFEAELHQQLLRQAAAHADHLQEALRIKEQELERKHVLELEEKLLHQKGIFISETSGNMARLKGVIEYLKAKTEFDESSKRAQALWLACQAMYYKITQDKSGNLSPLVKDIAAIKIAADKDNEFISSVVATIPAIAVSRGVFNNETLKERFEKVKHVCKQVALIDENNDSLYKYILSYLQSVLIVDTKSIPREELEGKIAVDSSEWDTYDILQRITYCLKIDDLEQALRYANQLKGEPKVVAKDWVNEIKLLLETQLAIKALLAHAAAVGVQAYH